MHTGQIRIIKTPSGEAPFKYHRKWKGLILPCYPCLGYLPEPERGALSNKETPLNRCVFCVPQDEAIGVLEENSPEAAAWWREKGFPKPGIYFTFAWNEARIVSGVTLQMAIEINHEMMGDPNR